MTTSHDSLSEENASRASHLFDEFVTTEKSSIEQHEFKDLSFTTPESFTQVIEHHARGIEDEGETATEVDADKRDIPIESSTVFIVNRFLNKKIQINLSYLSHHLLFHNIL
jgi:hypothetical protein